MSKGLTLFRGAKEIITMSGVVKKQGRHTLEKDLGILQNKVALTDNQKIIYIGDFSKLPSNYRKEIKKEVDLKKLGIETLMPGFIEPHTHLVFAGNRQHEFEMRNQGVSYQEIAAKGGGILSTVKATRKASHEKLFSLAVERTRNFQKQGVVCLEAKSGYGLDAKSELKILGIHKKLQLHKGLPEIISTFLGAHAIPRFDSKKMTEEMALKKMSQLFSKIKSEKLASRVDIFIEQGFFSASLARKYLQLAKNLNFDLVIHADQLSLSGGTELAIELDAKSADHVICIDEPTQKKLAKSNTVAVLLPAADLYMRCPYPPARKILDYGGRVAIATDFNPGSSPTQDLSLVGVLARLEMKMTLPEVIAATTWSAAEAVGASQRWGAIMPGYNSKFIGISGSWQELFYSVGNHPVQVF